MMTVPKANIEIKQDAFGRGHQISYDFLPMRFVEIPVLARKTFSKL